MAIYHREVEPRSSECEEVARESMNARDESDVESISRVCAS
jgi:hypothetical protein